MTTLSFLYNTTLGRSVLKILTNPKLSKASELFLNSSLSTYIIPGFVKKNKINMLEYEDEEYTCFNQFFCRNIDRKYRPIDMDTNHFIAPCDGLLSAYKIYDGLVLPIKQSAYRVSDLLGSEKLAKEFDGGTCLVFRLCVNHYHRYCYVDSGVKGKNKRIDGILHTVRPIALRSTPVFVENSREYTVIDTENFGRVVQMEVGAMLVGKIVNDDTGMCKVCRGKEKGHFEYGGSTVVVLVKKDQARFPKKLFEATDMNIEVPVKQGQKIGRK